jgi:hypothetical protein
MDLISSQLTELNRTLDQKIKNKEFKDAKTVLNDIKILQVIKKTEKNTPPIQEKPKQYDSFNDVLNRVNGLLSMK